MKRQSNRYITNCHCSFNLITHFNSCEYDSQIQFIASKNIPFYVSFCKGFQAIQTKCIY